MAKTNGSRNRSVGHSFELVTAKQLRLIYPEIASTRSCNRARDNEGIDLCNKDEYRHGRLPLNIQCKSVTGPVKYLDLMTSMPKEHKIINVVMHRYTKKTVTKAGDRFNVVGEFAITRIVDFIDLVRAKEALERITASKKLPAEAQKEIAHIIAQLKP